MNKSRPVLLLFSILAALDFIAAYAGLADYVGDKVAFFFILCTKAVQVGAAFYAQNVVVPVGDVAAYANNQGTVVAGPAAEQMNGSPVSVQQAR